MSATEEQTNDDVNNLFSATPSETIDFTEIAFDRLKHHANLALRSLERLVALVGLYVMLNQNRATIKTSLNEGQLSGVDDIARAAVVFTHATMEDFLRTLASTFLPETGADGIKGIPLAGDDSRSEKFTLSALLRHKGKTVDEVIAASVSQHLSMSTFNDRGDIKRLLDRIGFNGNAFEEATGDTLSELDKMSKRRHQIVHRSDRQDLFGMDTTLAPINTDEIIDWAQALLFFIQEVMAKATTIYAEKFRRQHEEEISKERMKDK